MAKSEAKSEASMMKLTLEDIKDIVDESYFSRADYFLEGGLVHFVTTSDSVVKSKVVGTSVYEVELRYEDHYLIGECSCPAFSKFGPCKHMAATGLAFIQHIQKKYKTSPDCLARIHKQDHFERLLHEKTKEQLIERILDNPQVVKLLCEEGEFEYNSRKSWKEMMIKKMRIMGKNNLYGLFKNG